jgi:hypothetical protein
VLQEVQEKARNQIKVAGFIGLKMLCCQKINNQPNTGKTN